MVFVIKQTDSSGSIIFQTTTPIINNTAPEIFFHKDSFKRIDKPIWTTNMAPGREGNFKHYNGSDDSEMTIKIYLYGSNRLTNLATIKTIQSLQIYLDASDIDSNLSGKYVVKTNSFKSEYDETKNIIIIDMIWEAYNN